MLEARSTKKGRERLTGKPEGDGGRERRTGKPGGGTASRLLLLYRADRQNTGSRRPNLRVRMRYREVLPEVVRAARCHTADCVATGGCRNVDRRQLRRSKGCVLPPRLQGQD